MSERNPRVVLPPIRFPLTVPKQSAGEPPPTAGSDYAGQFRVFISIPGFTDGLYFCDTNLSGVWGWRKVFGHGQSLDSLTIVGLLVAGDVATDDITCDDIAAGDITCASLTATGDIVADDVTGDVATFNSAVVGGNPIQAALTGTTTTDVPAIVSGGQFEFPITVTGAVIGDAVAVGAPNVVLTGLLYNARVTAANTVTVRIINTLGVTLDPTSATWRATIVR